MARTDDREQCRPRSSRISSSNGSTSRREVFFLCFFSFLKSSQLAASSRVEGAEEGIANAGSKNILSILFQIISNSSVNK